MDLLAFLSSINIIAFIAFLVILGFLIYEIFLLKKENKGEKKPVIPQFQQNLQVSVPINQPINGNEVVNISSSKRTNLIIIFLVILLLIFGAVTLVGFFAGSMQKKVAQIPVVPTVRPTATNIPTPTVTVVPTETIAVSESPTPSVSLTLTPSPTEIPLGSTSPTPTEIAAQVTSPSPTQAAVTALPETGNFNNLLVLFSVGSILIFFSFLF